MEILHFITLLISFNFVVTSTSPPIIIRNPKDWLLDGGNFSSGQPFSTTASLHDPPGVAKFTCDAIGTPPITYRWYNFHAEVFRLDPPISENSTNYWISGGTLIIRRFIYPYILCEAVNLFGSQMSTVAELKVSQTISASNMQLQSIESQIPILGCYNKNYDSFKMSLPGGQVTIFSQLSHYYKYHMQYSRDREYFMNLNDSRNPIGFAFAPFAVVHPARIPREGVFLCIQEYDPTFIVNSTKSRSLFPPPPSEYPLRYYRATATNSIPTDVKLRLLYNPPYNGLRKRTYRIGDDFQIACVAAVPAAIDFNLNWIGPENNVIAIDSENKHRVNTVNYLGFAAVLRIKNIQLSDSGNYACKVTFTNGSETNVTAYIRPTQPIQFLRTNEVVDKVLDEGQSMTLNCSFNASNQARRIVWLHNGKTVSDQTSLEKTTTYSISALDVYKDGGVYQCLVAENRDEIASMFRSTEATPAARRKREFGEFGSIFIHDFANFTVARLIVVRSVNKYDPVIISVSGDIVVFDVRQTASNLTTIIVSDRDKGSSGHISHCISTCIPKEAPCPEFHLVNRSSIRKVSDSLKVGDVGYTRKPEVSGKVRISMIISCSDSGDPQRSSSLSLQIILCNSNVSCEGSPASDVSETTKELAKLATTDVESMNNSQLQGYVQQLNKVTGTNPETLTSVDQYLAVESVGAVVDVTGENPSRLPQLMDNLTSVVGNILRVSPAVMEEGQRQVGIASRLLTDVNRITRQIPVKTVNKGSWHTSNLVLGATAPRPASSPYVRLDVTMRSSEVESSKILRAHNVSGKQFGASIAVRTSAVAGDRVDFSLFTSDTLFQAFSPNKSNLEIVSPIIAARAVLNKKFKDPVFLTFDFDRIPASVRNLSELQCVFWNFSSSQWDTSGCLMSSSSTQRVHCKCSHLTNFALLMTVDRGGGGRISAHHAMVLKVLSIITLVLSCLALLVTMIVYSSFLSQEQKAVRSGRKNSSASITASRILLCLCGSLLTGHLVFLAGGHHQKDDASCKVVAVLLHFFYLSAFTWSVVESVNIFVSLIYVCLKTDRVQLRVSRFFLKASVAAWASPALIVIITLAVNTSNYGLVMATNNNSSGERTDGLCFLKDISFYSAFLLPVLLCLVTNLVMLFLLVLVLKRQTDGSKFKDQTTSWRQRLVGFIGICLLLNVTWIIGTLQIGGATLAFMYLFVLINGSQGVFIFVLYCIQRIEIRHFMLKLFKLDKYLVAKEKDGRRKTMTTKTNTTVISNDTSMEEKSNLKSLNDDKAATFAEIHEEVPKMAQNEDIAEEYKIEEQGEVSC